MVAVAEQTKSPAVVPAPSAEARREIGRPVSIEGQMLADGARTRPAAVNAVIVDEAHAARSAAKLTMTNEGIMQHLGTDLA